MKKIFVPVFSAAAIMLAFTACNMTKAPMAVSKSVYTAVTEDEHQKLPEDLTLLTLEEAQEIAVQNNPDFKSRYYAISQARAAYYMRYSYYMPTVTGSYTMNSNHDHAFTQDGGAAGASFKTYSHSPALTASLLVFDSFQREMNLLAARHTWKQTEQVEQDAKRLLLQSVAYAYNNVMLAQAKRVIAMEDMRYNRTLLKETELKYGVGASTLSDVLNFEVNYNSAESNLYSANYALASSKYSLAALLGLTEGMLPETITFPEELSADGDMLSDVNIYLDMALTNRPDLRALREALEASKFSYYSSIAAFGPTVSAQIGLSYQNVNRRTSHYNYGTYIADGTASHARDGYFNSSLGVSWELFSGGRTFLAMRSAQAALSAAELNLAKTWISVVQDVRTAHENYIVGLKTVKLYQKNLEAVRKMRDLVDDEYDAGNCAITRVNEVQRQFVNAETSLAEAIVSMHNAKAQLDAATNSF